MSSTTRRAPCGADATACKPATTARHPARPARTARGLSLQRRRGRLEQDEYSAAVSRGSTSGRAAMVRRRAARAVRPGSDRRERVRKRLGHAARLARLWVRLPVAPRPPRVSSLRWITTLPRSSTRCANTSARADRRHEGGIALRADHPCVRRVYQPAAVPEREAPCPGPSGCGIQTQAGMARAIKCRLSREEVTDE
jgi:hypothetical protein